MVVCTVAAVGLVPLTIDLYTSEGSAAPTMGAGDVSASTAVDVPSAPQVSAMSDPAGSTAVDTEVDPEPAAEAIPTPGPDDASAVLGSLPDPAPAAPLPNTRTGEPIPSVVIPPSVLSMPSSGAVAEPVVEPVVEPKLEALPQGPTTDAVAVEEPVLTDSGTGSGMGGDLPPEVLPVPAYPQCPITEAGSWWTDAADPYTCIPPYPIQFHEPTPPGIPPELLEPVLEVPTAPEGSVGWYEPTPPGIDPSLLEPVMEDVGQPDSGE